MEDTRRAFIEAAEKLLKCKQGATKIELEEAYGAFNTAKQNFESLVVKTNAVNTEAARFEAMTNFAAKMGFDNFPEGQKTKINGWLDRIYKAQGRNERAEVMTNFAKMGFDNFPEGQKTEINGWMTELDRQLDAVNISGDAQDSGNDEF